MKERKFVKFGLRPNVFDIIIIVVAIVAGLVFLKLSNADGGGAALNPGKSVKARYTLELDNLAVGTAELIKPGDKLSDTVLNRAIGTVVSVTSSPYYVTSKNLYTGDYILTPLPNRESAFIVVEIDAVDNGTDITAGGFAVRGGTSIKATGPGYYGQGVIISVER